MSSFFVFVSLTLAIAIVTLGSIYYAYRRSRDSFHPAIYLGLMLFVLYCYVPLGLLRSNISELLYFLSIPQLEYVQILNLIGVISILAGVFFADKKINLLHYSKQNWALSRVVRNRIQQGAIVCGVIGVLTYGAGILTAGGFAAAYGTSYGGGWSASGYAREGILLTLPALLWLMTSRIQQRLSTMDWFWLFIFCLPLLLQGFLGARRGPTAMILISAVMGWHLIRMRRPNLWKTIGGAVVLGVLMIFLVTNRNQIYLGSDFDFEAPTENYLTRADSGNEFIYGSGVILDADAKGKYFWGRRYFTVFFIRPIPRQLWPTKYQDAAEFFDIPNLDNSNLGTGATDLAETTGWSGAYGAAPGLIADMWLEFWWLYTVVLFSIGWLYGMAWRKVITRGGLWIPTYTIATALSVYLIMQTLEAMAFRFLFTSAASWLIWRYSGADRIQHYLPSQPSQTYSVYEHK
ncbi:MAG: hypothetical protein QNJ72_42440 [Pleurocapsa sp. MO_226.B13]|nr:hypothetical protein [Pleurocapsa sp. MO_226.B13]